MGVGQQPADVLGWLSEQSLLPRLYRHLFGVGVGFPSPVSFYAGLCLAGDASRLALVGVVSACMLFIEVARPRGCLANRSLPRATAV